MNYENFYEKIEGFSVLPEKIDEVTTDCFRKVFSSEVDDKNTGIVYIWRCEKNIQRLKGESNIIYIGQTKQTFKQRYLRHSQIMATNEFNNMKYSHIVENYGPITISVAKFEEYGSTPYEAESKLLEAYFKNHCEYPPVNYS